MQTLVPMRDLSSQIVKIHVYSQSALAKRHTVIATAGGLPEFGRAFPYMVVLMPWVAYKYDTVLIRYFRKRYMAYLPDVLLAVEVHGCW